MNRLRGTFLNSIIRASSPVVSNIRHACGEVPGAKGLVVGIYQKEGDKGPKLTTSGEKLNERLHGRLEELICQTKIDGRLGRGKVFNNIDPEYTAIAVVGVGLEGIGFNELEMLDEGMENVRKAAGIGARSLQEVGCQEVSVDSMDYAEQAAEGAGLATWRFTQQLSKKNTPLLPKLELYDSPELDNWTRGIFKADAQNLARRLSDAAANCMTPTTFAQNAVDALCPCGITVEVRTMDWIETQRLHSFLMIAKGSCEPPVLMELSYCGTEPEEKPIMFLGKGITFNTGGINIRSCKDMDEYRACMSGAAACVAMLRCCAALSLPINIVCILPLCENIHYKPRLVVDVALWQGTQKAFGGGATGIFSNSHYIWKQFQGASALTGDRVWRLPLWNYYKRQVTDELGYDLSNDGRGRASSCLAAAVLNEMVPCSDWAHLDTRGTGMLTTYGIMPYLTKGRMTGRPTRTLVQFIYQLACPNHK
ncbi:GL15464 [Drosophila persimilis]|uniref:Cytosol aminopeptidase n=1 Tax=Drosophila persimilis TaxID=7234 RepID=B4H6Q7_DROPE|nr:GL15464 [Drosophila persimilis]